MCLHRHQLLTEILHPHKRSFTLGSTAIAAPTSKQCTRATSAPSQQLFSSLLGLQVTPRLAREASAFWQKIREVRDIAARDQIWSGILPNANELLAPDLFLASTEIPDDLSGLI